MLALSMTAFLPVRCSKWFAALRLCRQRPGLQQLRAPIVTGKIVGAGLVPARASPH
jgi:hypothetical protein